MSLDAIRDEEITALARCIAVHGRAWKHELRQAWQKAIYPAALVPTERRALEALRGRMGETVLNSLTTDAVQAEARAIEHARDALAVPA